MARSSMIAGIAFLVASPVQALEVDSEPPLEVGYSIAQGSDEAETRSGLCFGLGFGAGVSTLASAKLDHKTGSYSLRLGYALNPQMVLMAEVAGFGQYIAWKANSPVAGLLSSVGLQMMMFSERSLHAAIGLGWASIGSARRLNDSRDGNAVPMVTVADGVAWMTGVGYDFSDDGTSWGVQLRIDGAGVSADRLPMVVSLNLTWHSY